MSRRTPLFDAAAQSGAVWADEAGWTLARHFGDPAAEYESARAAAVVFDRSHHGKVEVTGPDARSFLHNLSSNDITGLAPDHGCEAFLLTAKARVVGHVLIFHVARPDGPTLWLDAGPGMGEKVRQHLDHYLISERVEIAERTEEYAQLHVAGPAARAVLESAFVGTLPELGQPQQMPLTAGSNRQIRRHDVLGLPGYDLVIPRAEAADIWQTLLAAGARPAGLDTYETLRVEAGTPLYGKDIDESHLAMETGRTPHAISFTKGCYLGQEPVVRSRDLGHVNRGLVGLKFPDGTTVPHGAKLFRAGAEVGSVTTCVMSPRAGAIALGYVRRGSQEPGTALEVEAAGTCHPAVVASLPFGGAAGAG
jgi:folate-binding protein YgfZ